MIYAFFKKDALVMQIFISETKKVKFININNEAHEILEIMDEEIALEEYIGFSKSIFYNNIFYMLASVYKGTHAPQGKIFRISVLHTLVIGAAMPAHMRLELQKFFSL